MRGVVAFTVVVVLVAALLWQARNLESRPVPLEWRAARVVVTGASSGIGLALARQLAAKGAALTLVARRPLAALCEESLRSGAAACVAVQADLGTREGVAATVAELRGTQPFDAIILNHGISGVKNFTSLTEADLEAFEQIMWTNFHGVTRLIHGLYDRVRPGGSLAVMGSVAGLTGPPYRGGYSPSKFALRSLMQVLHHDLAHRDLYLTYLAPGFVMSELHDRLVQGAAKRQSALSFMTAEECARQSLVAVAEGRREYRHDWLPNLLMPLEGIASWSGFLDPLILRRATAAISNE